MVVSPAGRSTSAYSMLAVLATGATAGGALISQRNTAVETAHARIAELKTKCVQQDSALRGLETRLEALQAEMQRDRKEASREKAKLGSEIEALRAEALRAASSEASVAKAHIASVEARVALLREAADRDRERKVDVALAHRELVEPTVRVNAKSEVGSGSLIYSRKRNGRVRTFVLTAWHIVKDNFGADTGPTPIDIDIYDAQGKSRDAHAKLVARHETLDLALLEVELERPCSVTARLPRPSDLERATVFSKVYAIGCPLGYAPMPTSGEITSKGKELDGITYWMTNAPTIFGNSGGGIYLSESRMLIGVLSRISAYKNLIDVAVPHMGIVTPITLVYEWLDSTEFAFIHREGLEGESAVLEASQSK